MKSPSDPREARRFGDKRSMSTKERPPSSPTLTDRGSGVALWRQIAEDLENDILSGRLKTNARLPTEFDLAERFAVNRHTVRRAIAELSRKGLLEALPGRGTYVRAPRLAYTLGSETRFSESIANAGREPSGKLVAHRRIIAPEDIRNLLKLASGAEVVEMNLVRAADKVPVCFSTYWYPHNRFGSIAEAFAQTGTVTKALAKFGVSAYRRKETRVLSRRPDSHERNVLQLDRRTHILCTDALAVDINGTPIQASQVIWAADRVQLVVEH